ncbi:MAG: hypothetical protein AAFY29_20010 [Pseudomonadota bacterium]
MAVRRYVHGLLVPSLFALLAAHGAQAQSEGMQSDWLELVKGHRDSRTGAQIMGVADDASTGDKMVMVKVPKAVLASETDMEEVRVVAQVPEKRELTNPLPELETQWVDDYDNDHYGLLVKLKEDQRLPFRLFFSAEGQGGSIGGIQP